jgi:hypothetical protein
LRWFQTPNRNSRERSDQKQNQLSINQYCKYKIGFWQKNKKHTPTTTYKTEPYIHSIASGGAFLYKLIKLRKGIIINPLRIVKKESKNTQFWHKILKA